MASPSVLAVWLPELSVFRSCFSCSRKTGRSGQRKGEFPFARQSISPLCRYGAYAPGAKLDYPGSALVSLCLHSNPDIRGAVARNTNCPQEALSVLAKDHEAGIRHALAENPRSPIAVLEFLANDKNPLIAWRAQNNLNTARGRRTVNDLKLPDWQAMAKKQAATTHHKLPYSDELSASEETMPSSN